MPASLESLKTRSSPVWLSDLGNGSYRNPILYADYSDPDAIRVGQDYWMTSSSFCHFPGLPILQSRDLVNWQLVNHALPRHPENEFYATPKHGCGVWAPSMRHHAGKYWIFIPDPDFGIYVITTDHPTDAWSKPVLLKAGRGLIDPCPLWDEDGRAYLIHGWAKSRSGLCNILTLHEMSPDASQLLDKGEIVINGNTMEGWHTIEGPKLYKRNGYYYIFAPAGGVATGYQAVFRSRSIKGPYESRIVLEQGRTMVNGPHQGAWVDTPEGDNWFLHFQELPAYGRIVHLQPMDWQDDWPRMGSGVLGNDSGEPVYEWEKPAGSTISILHHEACFGTASQLALSWQWQCNPSSEWFQLENEGQCLRLHGTGPDENPNLWNHGPMLMQKFPAPEFFAEVALHWENPRSGLDAGLVVFGYDYAWIGLRQDQEGLNLVLIDCINSHLDGTETCRHIQKLTEGTSDVRLQVFVQSDRTCRFRWSPANGNWRDIDFEFLASSSKWVGAKVGVFARGPKSAEVLFSDFLIDRIS